MPTLLLDLRSQIDALLKYEDDLNGRGETDANWMFQLSNLAQSLTGRVQTRLASMLQESATSQATSVERL